MLKISLPSRLLLAILIAGAVATPTRSRATDACSSNCTTQSEYEYSNTETINGNEFECDHNIRIRGCDFGESIWDVFICTYDDEFGTAVIQGTSQECWAYIAE